MTDLVNLSDFSYTKGLNLGGNSKSLTYLYGLSDFWQYMFQDTTTVNLLLEATSVQASDIYSKFLQLSGGISISDIATSASSQLLLEIVSTDSVVGEITNIISGSWSGGFTTLKVEDITLFSIGDIINVSGVRDLTIYDLGAGINIDVINEGGATTTVSGALWNGTFSITGVDDTNRLVTYYQATTPGTYTQGGEVLLTSIGAETYNLSDRITSSRFIANRPFLPTVILEEEVDYHIDAVSSRVSFAKKLSEYGFPSRLTETGATEYSLWFVDVRYDETLIYSTFPTLLGRHTLQSTSENYRNFLYGLFYIYTSGPSVSVIEKGLNLILGIPLARDDEDVLEIRQYLSTGQSIVITDYNSYIIPEGLTPTVSMGDSIKVGDELSKWVEVIDNQNTPGWWNTYPIEIPPSMMPNVPTGYSRLVMDDVSNYANWLMRTYLKNNSYLIKVNTSLRDFTFRQEFESIPSIISELSPSHTGAIYYYFSIIPIKAVFTRGYVGFVTPVKSMGLTGITLTSSMNDVRAGTPFFGNSASLSVGNLRTHTWVLIPSTSSTLSLGVTSMGAELTATSATFTPVSMLLINSSPEVSAISDTAVGGGGVS